MPELLRVHALQPKIAHCAMNNGYRIRNGGFGTVSAIVTEHPILRNQAKISRVHRTGLLRQSSRIQLIVLVSILFIKLLAGNIFAFGFTLNIKLIGKT